jgi:CRP/FNR family transcriptional regulator
MQMNLSAKRKKQMSTIKDDPAVASGHFQGGAHGDGKSCNSGLQTVPFRLRTGSRHPIADSDAIGYILKSGCLLLDITLGADRRYVHILHYPGDTIVPQALPMAIDVGMLALSDCELERVPVDQIGPVVPLPGQRIEGRMYVSDVAARSTIHAAAVGRLSGDERLATLLLEMALYLGFDAPGGRVFDQPLSRKDIADLLGLNPDTLSRMMTRLRNENIVSIPTRSRMVVRDLKALARMTPLAAAIEALHRTTHAPKAA